MEPKRFWQFRAADNNPKTGELRLYGPISSETWWGDEVTPQQFKQDLDALGPLDELHVFINSDGGDVFVGQAIHSMLKRHKSTVIVYVDGLAASIASVIAMAGDVVRMPRNAMMMIHNPWTIAMGSAPDFRKLADDLDQVREAILTTYQDKTGMSRAELIPLLDAETWLTAEEAVAMGFADEIEQTKKIAASLRGGQLIINGQPVDLSRYHNPPTLAFVPEESADEVAPAEVPQQDQLPTEPPPAPQEGPESDPPAEPPQPEEPQGRNLDLARRRLDLYQRRLG